LYHVIMLGFGFFFFFFPCHVIMLRSSNSVVWAESLLLSGESPASMLMPHTLLVPLQRKSWLRTLHICCWAVRYSPASLYGVMVVGVFAVFFFSSILSPLRGKPQKKKISWYLLRPNQCKVHGMRSRVCPI
jgi:hypothetical protein